MGGIVLLAAAVVVVIIVCVALSESACASGHWKPKGPSSVTCVPCGLGTEQPSSDNRGALCSECKNGYFADKPGTSQCRACHPGSYQPDRGASSCYACERGYHASVDGSVQCRPCSLGTYADAMGLGDCLKCAAGSYSPALGAIWCLLAPAGSYCPTAGMSSTLPCPAGFACPEAATVEPLKCSVGTYSRGGALVCTDCPEGTFCNMTGISSPLPCPVGHFCPRSRTIIPIQCAAGYFSAYVGAAACTPCSDSSIAPQPGAATCQECRVGNLANPQRTACIGCRAGYSGPGVGRCEPCPAGTSSEDDSIACHVCLAGSFAPTPASSACRPCNPGYFTGINSSLQCEPCPEGTFSSGDACPVCATGFWCGQAAMAQAIPCLPPASKCLGGSLCSRGYGGYLCGTCGDRFYRSLSPDASASTCTACPDLSEWAPLAIILGVIFIIIFVAPSTSNAASAVAKDAIMTTGKSLLLMVNLRVPWPPAFVELFRAFSFVSLGFGGTECLFTWNWSWFFWSTILLAATSICIVVASASKWCRASCNTIGCSCFRGNGGTAVHWTAHLHWTCLRLQPILYSRALQAVVCTAPLIDGKRLLVYDTSVTCWSDMSHVATGSVAIVLLLIALPVAHGMAGFFLLLLDENNIPKGLHRADIKLGLINSFGFFAMSLVSQLLAGTGGKPFAAAVTMLVIESSLSVFIVGYLLSVDADFQDSGLWFQDNAIKLVDGCPTCCFYRLRETELSPRVVELLLRAFSWFILLLGCLVTGIPGGVPPALGVAWLLLFVVPLGIITLFFYVATLRRTCDGCNSGCCSRRRVSHPQVVTVGNQLNIVTHAARVFSPSSATSMAVQRNAALKVQRTNISSASHP